MGRIASTRTDEWLIIFNDAGSPAARSIPYSFPAISRCGRVAHIRTVDMSTRLSDNQTLLLKEIEMNPIMATAARAITICIVATLGFNAADATAGGVSNDQAETNAPLKYVVQFSDLDLSRIEGATALYARLRHAAHVVCDPFESRELGLAKKYRTCMDKAIADAVTSVNRPLLTQYHQSRTKGDKAGAVQVAKADAR
jgi:UrcA family protein